MKASALKASKDWHVPVKVHIHTNHVLYFSSHFIFLNILTNKLPLCLPLTLIPQMLCHTALQQLPISFLCAFNTMHALVELIEISQAHPSKIGAMCCAVCQPVIHV